MDLQMNTVLAAPSRERIKWFEKVYRVQLPADYVSFLGSGNGGTPIQNVFDSTLRERLVEYFLCLLDQPQSDPVRGWNDITVVTSQLDERLLDDPNLIGFNVIPIGVLFGGDFLCLDFRQDPGNPKVVIWDHEQSEAFAPSLEVIADSFSLFTKMLRVSK